MDISIIKKNPIYREERFRTPSELECQFGLWVDRVGEQARYHQIQYLRKLGQYAAVLFEKGDGKLLRESYDDQEINSGDIVLLFPEEPMAYNPYRCWSEKWIVWNGPEATDLENAGFVRKSRFLIKGKRPVFLEAFNSLRSLINLQDKASILERKIILVRFILDLYKTKPNTCQEGEYSEYIESAVDFLTSNYNKNLSIDELALRFKTSTSHFRLLFKEYTGTSPRKFITNLRVSVAKKLLAQGLTVKQTAHSIGYDDIFYFIRIFKSLTGRSPGAWQKSHLRF